MKTDDSPTPAEQPLPPSGSSSSPVQDPEILRPVQNVGGSSFGDVKHSLRIDTLNKKPVGELLAPVFSLRNNGKDNAAKEYFDAIIGELSRIALGAADEQSLAAFLACRVDMDNPPKKPQPRFLLGDADKAAVVSTPGNLTCLTAKSKAGKSAFLGAWAAAAICAEYDIEGADTLGAWATRPKGRCLLRIDTEQSDYDGHQQAQRILQRAGVDKMPDWMESFVVTSMTADSIKEALPQIMEQMQEKHGGIFAVMIDGAADMVLGINEDKECAALVHELHQLAIRFDCPIISVVHSNEGMQAGNAARGWLGRQFMRKAESNIILEISNGVTSVYGEQMRGAPIPKSQAICFQWSDEHMMHVSAAGAAEARMQQKQDGLRELAEEVFEGGNKPLSYRELIEAIRGANSCSVRTAKTRCKELGDAKIISKSMGVYTLAQ